MAEDRDATRALNTAKFITAPRPAVAAVATKDVWNAATRKVITITEAPAQGLQAFLPFSSSASPFANTPADGKAATGVPTASCNKSSHRNNVLSLSHDSLALHTSHSSELSTPDDSAPGSKVLGWLERSTVDSSGLAAGQQQTSLTAPAAATPGAPRNTSPQHHGAQSRVRRGSLLEPKNSSEPTAATGPPAATASAGRSPTAAARPCRVTVDTGADSLEKMHTWVERAAAVQQQQHPAAARHARLRRASTSTLEQPLASRILNSEVSPSRVRRNSFAVPLESVAAAPAQRRLTCDLASESSRRPVQQCSSPKHPLAGHSASSLAAVGRQSLDVSLPAIAAAAAVGGSRLDNRQVTCHPPLITSFTSPLHGMQRSSSPVRYSKSRTLLQDETPDCEVDIRRAASDSGASSRSQSLSGSGGRGYKPYKPKMDVFLSRVEQRAPQFSKEADCIALESLIDAKVLASLQSSQL